MRVVGLQILTKGTKRVVHGVVLDPTTDSVIDLLNHVPNPRHSDAVLAREARDALSSQLKAHELGAVVLLEADYHPRAKVTSGTKERLRLEGACLTACLDNAPRVVVMNGPALGRACGTNKQGAVAAAAALGLSDDYVESGAAALAAKTLLN